MRFASAVLAAPDRSKQCEQRVEQDAQGDDKSSCCGDELGEPPEVKACEDYTATEPAANGLSTSAQYTTTNRKPEVVGLWGAVKLKVDHVTLQSVACLCAPAHKPRWSCPTLAS